MTLKQQAVESLSFNVLIAKQDFDLTKGESPESTTAYGHAFLDLIRRTADKR
jgi:hypothetical protein